MHRIEDNKERTCLSLPGVAMADITAYLIINSHVFQMPRFSSSSSILANPMDSLAELLPIERDNGVSGSRYGGLSLIG